MRSPVSGVYQRGARIEPEIPGHSAGFADWVTGSITPGVLHAVISVSSPTVQTVVGDGPRGTERLPVALGCSALVFAVSSGFRQCGGLIECFRKYWPAGYQHWLLEGYTLNELIVFFFFLPRAGAVNADGVAHTVGIVPRHISSDFGAGQ